MAEQRKIHKKCPECGQKYRWKEHHAGRRVRCGNCQAKLRYPDDPTGRMHVLTPPPENANSSASKPNRDDDEPSHEPVDAGHLDGLGEYEDEDHQHAAASPGSKADTYDLAGDPDADLAESGRSGVKPEPGAAEATDWSSKVGPSDDGQAGDAVKPSTGKSGSRQRSSSGSGESLLDEQQQLDEPAAVTDHQARRKRDEARQAMAQELAMEEYRRQKYVYPGLVLAIGVVLQYVQLLLLGNAALSGLVESAIGSGLHLLILLPLVLLLTWGARELDFEMGDFANATFKLLGVALLPMAIANFVPEPTAFGPIVLWLAIAAGGTWFLIALFFSLTLVEGLQLTAATVAVQILTTLGLIFAVTPLLEAIG